MLLAGGCSSGLQAQLLANGEMGVVDWSGSPVLQAVATVAAALQYSNPVGQCKAAVRVQSGDVAVRHRQLIPRRFRLHGWQW